MEIRCQNCGERISPPSAGSTETEVTCAACGAAMRVVPKVRKQEVRRHRVEVDDLPRRERNWRRVFEPIPRPALYVAGIVLALALLSPFWVYLLQDQYSRKRIFISDDTTNLVRNTSSNTDTNLTAPIFENSTQPISLSEFRGIRLEAAREDLLRRFNLRLQNTRGMEPEIYEAYRLGDVEHLKANFYGGLLKDVEIISRDSRHDLAAIQQELISQFGTPLAQTDSQNTVAAVGVGLISPSLSGDDDAKELQRKLAALTMRRDFIWASDQHRVTATVYHNATRSGPALVSVRLSAAAWLLANQPLSTGIALPPGTPNPLPNAPGPRDLLK